MFELNEEKIASKDDDYSVYVLNLQLTQKRRLVNMLEDVDGVVESYKMICYSRSDTPQPICIRATSENINHLAVLVASKHGHYGAKFEKVSDVPKDVMEVELKHLPDYNRFKQFIFKSHPLRQYGSDYTTKELVEHIFK